MIRGQHCLRFVILASSMLAFSSATAGEGGSRGPVRSLLEIRQDKVVIQRWDLSCGAAALATVLTYQHGDGVPEKTIAERMLQRTNPLRVRVRGGFSLLDLKRYVETRGYRGTGYRELVLDDLVAMGPTIVPVSFKGYDHFVVFRGVQDGRVLLADPAFGNRIVTVSAFEKAWKGGLGFVVQPPDGATVHGELAPLPKDFRLMPDAVVRSALR